MAAAPRPRSCREDTPGRSLGRPAAKITPKRTVGEALRRIIILTSAAVVAKHFKASISSSSHVGGRATSCQGQRDFHTHSGKRLRPDLPPAWNLEPQAFQLVQDAQLVTSELATCLSPPSTSPITSPPILFPQAKCVRTPTEELRLSQDPESKRPAGSAESEDKTQDSIWVRREETRPETERWSSVSSLPRHP